MRTEIKLLGQGQVRVDGVDVDASAWRTAKTFDLLRLLALSVDEPVPIDTLLGTFWPDADHAHAGTSLRNAACRIRKVLGSDSVVREGHGMVLTGSWVDVRALKETARLVDEARARGNPALVLQLVLRAEALYGADVDVSTTECGALHEASAELRTLRGRLLLDGAEAAGRCADWHRSLLLAQQAATVETSDRVTRALMRAWFAVGETGKPVEEFERLRRHLSDEYGVDPAPQTRALYLEVVSACTEWPPRGAVVGREDEVRRVVTEVTTRLMDPDGATGVVWLVGLPGSGRRTVGREAARTLMLPVREGAGSRADGATVELLPDQGRLTPGLAAMLRLRAETWRRVMVVPVSSLAPGAVTEGDAAVTIGPLDRDGLREVVALVLQGRPTDRLLDELLHEARGLPGAASRIARRRLEAADLVWTPEGVDSARSGPRATGLLGALGLAVSQLAMVLLLEVGDEHQRMAQERQTTTRSPTTTWSKSHSTPARSRTLTHPWEAPA